MSEVEACLQRAWRQFEPELQQHQFDLGQLVCRDEKQPQPRPWRLGLLPRRPVLRCKILVEEAQFEVEVKRRVAAKGHERDPLAVW